MTKAQLGEPVSFIGVTYRNMGEGLPQEQKCLKDRSITKSHTAQVTVHTSWSTLHSLQAAQQVENAFSRRLSSSHPLPCSLVTVRETFSSLFCLYTLGGGGESGQFQGLPGDIFEL